MSWEGLFSNARINCPTIFGSNGLSPIDQAQDYLDFYKGTIPSNWKVPDHILQIAELLDAVDAGEIDRLWISMPPRHGKSETITVRAPLKFLMEHPADNVLVTGYNERFARKFGRRTRNMGIERGLVAKDKAASDEWVTTSGGIYMARGVGSPPTGTGFKRIYIDDPIRRREDAESEVYREKMWDWYSEDLYSRLEPGGAIIGVGTRWHHDDIIARAIASEPNKWTVVNLPAISDEGLALWPWRYDIDALERIRGVNPRSFEALYQGNPTPREGAFFLPDMMPVMPYWQTPRMEVVGRGWDLAATKDDGDYTAGAKLGRDENGRYYILNMRRERMELATRNKMITDMAESDGTNVMIVGPRDPAAAGKESALQFTSRLAGYNVSTVPITSNMSKEIQAEGFAAQVNAGNVVIVESPWNKELIDEMRTFPNGAYDDQIDALSIIFNQLWKQSGDHAEKDTRLRDVNDVRSIYEKRIRDIKLANRRRR